MIKAVSEVRVAPPDVATRGGATRAAQFRTAYGAHRAAEGRRLGRAQMLSLPYLRSGPLARQWMVRARSYEAFVRHVLLPAAAERTRPLRLLDLGWPVLAKRAARLLCAAHRDSGAGRQQPAKIPPYPHVASSGKRQSRLVISISLSYHRTIHA